MIRVPRTLDAPEVLTADGKKEQDDAAQAWQDLQAEIAAARAAGEKPPRLSFPFKTYKALEVKELLVALFCGKCAYCESFYSSTQPMDVEHFRPKGAVAEDKAHPGYYWLAATWDNLLPSCIDCNRKRRQDDVTVEDKKVSLGKKDHFPVAGDRARAKADSLSSEEALLINPALEDPDDFFVYDAELGVVSPREAAGAAHERAKKSIEVFGLNRSGLVTERRHVITLIQHHLKVVEKLTKLKAGLEAAVAGGAAWSDDLVELVDEVIHLELRALFAMRDRKRPYAGMVRQILSELGVAAPE